MLSLLFIFNLVFVLVFLLFLFWHTILSFDIVTFLINRIEIISLMPHPYYDTFLGLAGIFMPTVDNILAAPPAGFPDKAYAKENYKNRKKSISQSSVNSTCCHV